MRDRSGRRCARSCTPRRTRWAQLGREVGVALLGHVEPVAAEALARARPWRRRRRQSISGSSTKAGAVIAVRIQPWANHPPDLVRRLPPAGSLRDARFGRSLPSRTSRSWSPRPSSATRRAGSTPMRSRRSTSSSPISERRNDDGWELISAHRSVLVPGDTQHDAQGTPIRGRIIRHELAFRRAHRPPPLGVRHRRAVRSRRARPRAGHGRPLPAGLGAGGRGPLHLRGRHPRRRPRGAVHRTEDALLFWKRPQKRKTFRTKPRPTDDASSPRAQLLVSRICASSVPWSSAETTTGLVGTATPKSAKVRSVEPTTTVPFTSCASRCICTDW